MNQLDETYWNNRYLQNTASWDLGMPSPPLVAYINQLQKKDIAILIPGGGNSYEALYLLQNGFTNVTVVDIAEYACNEIRKNYSSYINNGLTVLHANFFDLTTTYHLILEQTFFCALHPSLRKNYVHKMHDLLLEKGKLVGLLFNREFEVNPAYGGNKEEYIPLFEDKFTINTMETCYNSVQPRAGVELFINLQKK
jgi:methyl halide transferase